MALLAAYLASWMATSKYGMASGRSQFAPMPFLIVDHGVPHFSNFGNEQEPFVMEQEKQYLFWCFGEQHLIFGRTARKTWTGSSSPERREIMKEIARAYGKSKTDPVVQTE